MWGCIAQIQKALFPECVAVEFPFHDRELWGLKVCSLDVAQPVATGRVRAVWPCLWNYGKLGHFF